MVGEVASSFTRRGEVHHVDEKAHQLEGAPPRGDARARPIRGRRRAPGIVRSGRDRARARRADDVVNSLEVSMKRQASTAVSARSPLLQQHPQQVCCVGHLDPAARVTQQLERREADAQAHRRCRWRR